MKDRWEKNAAPGESLTHCIIHVQSVIIMVEGCPESEPHTATSDRSARWSEICVQRDVNRHSFQRSSNSCMQPCKNLKNTCTLCKTWQYSCQNSTLQAAPSVPQRITQDTSMLQNGTPNTFLDLRLYTSFVSRCAGEAQLRGQACLRSRLRYNVCGLRGEREESSARLRPTSHVRCCSCT